MLLALSLTFATPSHVNAQKSEKGFVSIFDGKTLKGWDGDPKYWKVENGSLVGQITPETLLKTNSFIIWQGGEPGDFELRGSFKIAKDGNSGINYRSEQLTDVPYALKGYQADIDGKNNYTGQNYEERKRTTLAYRGQKTVIKEYTGDKTPDAIRANVKNNAWTGFEVTGSLGSSDSLKTLIKSEDWNTFRLVVRGNHLQHYINDVLMSDVTDNDTYNGAKKGKLGVQVHVGPPMKVEYKDLRIKQ
ncbi:3-keto-disaccharide hydrolase [Dyadobacter sandarakinus]|nr:DUF1080 domain-containing protein [Dyadobacter sandarakinus]